MADIQIGVGVDTGTSISDVEDFSRKSSSALRKFGSEGSSAMKKLTGGIGDTLKSLFSLKGILLTLVSGVAMKRFIDLSNQQEEASAQLAQALGHSGAALEEYASSLQKATTFGDEQIIQAEALIAAFDKDEEHIKLATKATLDLAAAKGMDLKTAADLVSKTLGSSTNALSRYGIEVEGAVGSSERLASLVQNLTDKFGGQAEALAATDSGGLKSLGNAIGDVEEGLGDLLKTILGPLAKQATPVLISFSETLKDFVKSDEFRAKAESFADTVSSMASALGWLIGKVIDVAEEMGAFANVVFDAEKKIVKFISDAVVKIAAFPARVFASGQAMVDEFIKGIEDRMPASLSVVSGWLKSIRNYFSPEPAEDHPLSTIEKAGEAVPEALSRGISAKKDLPLAASSEMVASINEILSRIRMDLDNTSFSAFNQSVLDMQDSTSSAVENINIALSAIGPLSLPFDGETGFALDNTAFTDFQQSLLDTKTIFSEQGRELAQTSSEMVASINENLSRVRMDLDNTSFSAFDQSLLDMQDSTSSAVENINIALSEIGTLSLPVGGETGLALDNTAFTDFQQSLLDTKTSFSEQTLELAQTTADAEVEINANKNAEILANEKQINAMRVSAALLTTGALASAMQNLFEATGSKSKELFVAYKVFAVSQAMISAYLGAAKALATVPYPFNFAAAAAVFAAGVAQAASIASQDMTGSTAGAAPGGGGSTPAPAGAAPTVETSPPGGATAAPANLTVQFFNPLGTEDWDAIVQNDIAPAFERALDRNITIVGT